MDFREPKQLQHPCPPSNWVIWQNGGVARRFDHDEVTVESSLSLALARFTGVAHGVPYTLPAMLLPDLFRSRPFEGLEDLIDDGDDVLNSRRCRRVSGRRHRSHEQQITLWIDDTSFLLRRIFERTHFGTTALNKQAADADARLKAIGIPKRLRPPIRYARKQEPFDTEQTVDYSPELEKPIFGPIFDFVPGRKC